ncbi:MAG: hypothetical protein RIS47_2008 [Bacteroidota bacterium]|jgi:hypothetical protein
MDTSDIIRFLIFAGIIIYSISKQVNKKNAAKKPSASQRPNPETPPSQQSSEEMDDYLEEIRRMLSQAEETQAKSSEPYDARPDKLPFVPQYSHPAPIQTPVEAAVPVAYEQFAGFDHEHKAAVETVYVEQKAQSKETYYEQSEGSDEMMLRNKEMDEIDRIEKLGEQKRVQKKQLIDLRKAVIYQTILQRKY